MAISREKKQETLKKLTDIVGGSESVVFVNFHGLNVTETNALRNDLRESKIGYLVAKKSLLRKVLEKVKGDELSLEGELSLAYGKDALDPARKIFSFQQKFKEKLYIMGGIFEGSLISKEKMTEIAQIPSQKILYAQFVNLINSPIQRLVVGLSKIAEKKS